MREREAAGAHQDRPSPQVSADEKTTLVMFLRYLRQAVVAKCGGLTEEQARRPGVDSGTSLAWLVKHLGRVERDWVLWSYAGTAESYLRQDVPLEPGDTLERLLSDDRAATTAADAVIEACTDLDAIGARPGRGDSPPTMRWVLTHLVEETARHAGHADILRERLDGAVGR